MADERVRNERFAMSAGRFSATAAGFNRAVYERLKPGCAYVISDHAAAAGTGASDTRSLHRIDPASVRKEVEAAGFVP